MPDTNVADAASARVELQFVERVLVRFPDGSQEERGDTDTLMSFLLGRRMPGPFDTQRPCFLQWRIDGQDEHWSFAGSSPGASRPARVQGLFFPLQPLFLVLGFHIGFLLRIDMRWFHELSVCWLRIASAQTAHAYW
jgi:hypothetical protein